MTIVTVCFVFPGKIMYSRMNKQKQHSQQLDGVYHVYLTVCKLQQNTALLYTCINHIHLYSSIIALITEIWTAIYPEYFSHKRGKLEKKKVFLDNCSDC